MQEDINANSGFKRFVEGLLNDNGRDERSHTEADAALASLVLDYAGLSEEIIMLVRSFDNDNTQSPVTRVVLDRMGHTISSVKIDIKKLRELLLIDEDKKYGVQ